MIPRMIPRAQTAMEFLILAGFMLLVLISFLFMINDRSAEAAAQNRQRELAATAAILRDEISNAHRVQDGFSRIFELPATVNGEPYTVSIDQGTEALFRGQNEEYVLFLPTRILVNTTGTPQLSGMLRPGKNLIYKENGQIFIR